MCTCTRMYVYTCTCPRVHAHLKVQACMCTLYTYTHVCVHVYVHVYAFHIHIYAYTYTCARARIHVQVNLHKICLFVEPVPLHRVNAEFSNGTDTSLQHWQKDKQTWLKIACFWKIGSFSKWRANFWPDKIKLQHIPATLQKKWAHFIKYWLRYSQISFAIFSVASPLWQHYIAM